jgi:hypothetical protein
MRYDLKYALTQDNTEDLGILTYVATLEFEVKCSGCSRQERCGKCD